MTTERTDGASSPGSRPGESVSDRSPAGEVGAASERGPRSSRRGRRPTAYRVILEPRGQRKPASVREPRVVIGAIRPAPAASVDRRAVTLPRLTSPVEQPPAPTERAPARVAAAPAERSSYAPGDVLAERYRLVGPIGSGGMGSVWRARNLGLELDVALKLVRRGCWVPEASERLLREARAAARVAHPAAVRVFDYGVTSRGDPFFVMELLRGRPLSRALAAAGTLAPLAAVQLLLPITGALIAAHREGIVHRDLKPQNVLLVDDGRRVIPKLIDFGIASAERAWARKLTSNDLRVGSPAYMAPEQSEGSEPDPRTDVWGICFLLHELVTGSRPPRPPHGERPLGPQQGGAPGLERLLAHPGLASIVARGLERSPEDRWPTMEALSSALAEWALRAGAVWDVMRTSLAVYYAPAGEKGG
ncbi:MAG: serine/threonine protein kinase [Polyangiaceae bacterium]|nr:serine/threonine protein kinase [Polyangiaceae bacterium]